MQQSNRIYSKTITRSNFAKHWGEPCKLYCDGCPTCNAWDDWTAMTGEVIKYKGHDVAVCDCANCFNARSEDMLNRIDSALDFPVR